MLTLNRFQSSERLSGENSPFHVTSHPLPVYEGHLYLSKKVYSEWTSTFIRKGSCDFSCYVFDKQNTSDFWWDVVSGPGLLLLLLMCCCLLITCYWHSAPSLPCSPWIVQVSGLGPVACPCPYWDWFLEGLQCDHHYWVWTQVSFLQVVNHY